MPSLPATDDNSFVNQWLPWGVSAVVAGLMAWWAIVYVMPIFQTDDESIATAAPVKAKTPPARKLDIDKLNLFGKTEKSAVENKPSDAKPTRLKLTLRGILATDDPRTGLAQIQQQKEEKYFAVGNEVFGQAILEEIYVDRVVLLVGDVYETLLLPEEFLNNKMFESARLRQERKRVATEYRDIFLTRNGMELIKLFGFETRFRNGAFQGFVVKALGDKGREMMEVLGVENGDLIVEVNGLRFAESLEATAQLKDLADATAVDVIINRDGNEMPFHFEFDKRVKEIVQIPEGMTAEEYEDQQILAEPEYGESEEDQEYIARQRARRTGTKKAVEFDH